ncbi:alanine/glycine:cation symporter family protein [Pseudoleptotrichia goodfellowii]|uniref:Amino acid carrier protein n=1 Tax=Pseudoleptotrichia goodfellowii TaxID=157692 RepID=A0A510JCG5_9FUSO|nr:sodium:alanine symporter family protein [Pseudoleptotrichia goodfellowii]BBM35905.1 amino acid carrier protein [Pseudoleptotrichia goodfellowii]
MGYEKLVDLINTINSFIASNILMWGLLGAGAFLTLFLGFPQITKMSRAFGMVFGGLFKKKANSKEGSMSSFQALATAIAAQVGTGNVAGVATAITAGGPGAIFWMWVSAFLGMGTIFTEATLAQKYRKKIHGELVGGPAYYISYGLKKAGILSKFLAGFFAVSIILALGFMGNAVQSNSIASGIKGISGLENINAGIIGVIVAVLAALIFWGGMQRIAKFAELVVPIMAAVYILASIIVLIIFHKEIIPTVIWIFESAFTPHAAVGGIAGSIVKVAVQKGIARGLFSNEAGMGSTPHAHAVAHVNHPAEQGLSAMVGVFIDTILVCSATALSILVTGAYNLKDAGDKYLRGAQLTQGAFKNAFGEPGAILLAICLAFFAFTTIVGWYYFGESNIKYLFGKSALLPYRIIVIVCIIVGALQEVDIVWSLADIFNSLMVIPNLIAIVWLSGEAKELLADYNKKYEKNDVYYDYEDK